MGHANKNTEFLKSTEVIRKLADVLKTNIRACAAVGPGFISQIGRLYIDLLRVCNFYSSEISKAGKSEFHPNSLLLFLEYLLLVQVWVLLSTLS